MAINPILKGFSYNQQTTCSRLTPEECSRFGVGLIWFLNPAERFKIFAKAIENVSKNTVEKQDPTVNL